MAEFSTFFHGELSPHEAFCLKTFCDHGHAVSLYCYDPLPVPDFIKIRDAASVVPRDELYVISHGHGRGSIAQFANYFRYCLLELRDTWWIDTDVICLSADWPRSDVDVTAGYEDEEIVNNAVLKLGTSAARWCKTEALRRGRDVPWGTLGPKLLTSLCADERLRKHLFPPPVFYPIHYDDWWLPYLAAHRDEVAQACRGSFALHLWNEMGRRASLDKWRAPSPNSYIGELIAAHDAGRYFEACSPLGYEQHVHESRERWRALHMPSSAESDALVAQSAE